jgi:hypothetical protein
MPARQVRVFCGMDSVSVNVDSSVNFSLRNAIQKAEQEFENKFGYNQETA